MRSAPRAILEGTVHQLQPKLLTEGAAIVSIAPMLRATGVGAEVSRPMTAPVLGGLLVADALIDVFLPVLDFAVQTRRRRHRPIARSSRAAPPRPPGRRNPASPTVIEGTDHRPADRG